MVMEITEKFQNENQATEALWCYSSTSPTTDFWTSSSCGCVLTDEAQHWIYSYRTQANFSAVPEGRRLTIFVLFQIV